MAKDKQELEEYLAKIRRTIAESNRMVEQVELRMAETDRFLASQGLTREQVKNFKFTPEQRAAVNRELVKSGYPPLEDDDEDDGDGWRSNATIRAGDMQQPDPMPPADGELSARQQKFGMMMKQFVI